MQFHNLVISCADVFPVAEQIMRDGKGIRFVVSGKSMWPLIRHNRDSVLLKAINCPIRVGDIVLAHMESPENRYLLHRVIRLWGENSFETAGDNCTISDGLIDKKQIIGKVETIYRGSIIIQCRDPVWRILFTIWRLCFPVRGILLKLFRAICRLKASRK